MWYFTEKQIRRVHFEISNYCNARCPECPREDINVIDNETGVNLFQDWIDTYFLSLDIIKENFNIKNTPELQSISFCGCFGDAATHPKLIDIIDYFTEEFPLITIYLHTNGGLKTPRFWEELAYSLSNAHYHEVYWGLDGLEDTNHLYRVNVKWSKVKENWQAFNNAGGNSIWQFIVFPHNFHQVEEAKEYARQEGFSSFKTVISYRYSELKAEDLPEKYIHPNILNKDEDFDTMENKQQIQLLPTLDNIELNDINDGATTVRCESMADRYIFVFSEGTVWPCSKLGAWKYDDTYISKKIHDDTNARKINNLKNYSLQQIMNNEYFSSLYATHQSKSLCSACKEECSIKNSETRDIKVFEEFV